MSTTTTTTSGRLWETALGQLQLQMTRATFDSWLKDAHLISLDDNKLLIGVKNEFARDWLENRLFDTINRTVATVLGHPVEIEFAINDDFPEATEATSALEAAALPPLRKTPQTNGSSGSGKPLSTPAPETGDGLWQAILDRLQEEIPAGAFHTWLDDTYLVSRSSDKLVVGTRKDGAGVATIRDWQEWMAGGANPFITQAAEDILGHAVEVEYVAPAIEKGGSPFAPHIKLINAKTGYAPLPNYYIKYWESYLARRWKTTGVRAFLLRQKLIALDKRKVTSPEFTNWSPGFEMTYEELGELISVSITTITGRSGHCQKYEDDRKLGQPRGRECCGRHEQAGCRIEKGRRSGKLHCYFWRPGALEVLDTEKMIAIDSSDTAKNRHNRVRLQVWHSLSILTPRQVAWLPGRMQEKHQSWLIENASRMGWKVDEWRAETGETFIERATDYEVGRIHFGQFQPNPYREK